MFHVTIQNNFQRVHTYYLSKLLSQSASTHTALTVPLSQQLASSKYKIQSFPALEALVLINPLMYGENSGHLDQPGWSKLNHQLAL